MLELKGIKKIYDEGGAAVTALKGIDIRFRKNEFVAILGPSGCGKTTLLNIIGGLDGYTEGDLVIRGRSTKSYRDRDWDNYRNHSVGFVFQSYNLIPHQTVLKNVELALTLSGVGKRECRRRAEEALEKVGLKDQMRKKPNQMSGGQMQRVAIARALVNDPEILLADEPTGALDSTTSVQVMDILREVAKDRLVIMVTHNPDLAASYATRTVRLLDGGIVDDSDPWDGTGEETAKKENEKEKKPSMSFLTALGLSLNNLLTKKGRTLLTAFAGSIGIIGIALILSVSSGVSNYISRVQEDTLSSYPIQIEAATLDVSATMEALIGEVKADREGRSEDRIYANSIMTEMLSSMSAQVRVNDLGAFKAFIDETEDGKTLRELSSDVKYGYSTPLTIYRDTENWGLVQTNPCQIMNEIGMGGQDNGFSSALTGNLMASSSLAMMDVWTELMDNSELLSLQFETVRGRMPERYDEAVVIVNRYNEISDYTLYALGLRDPEEPAQVMRELLSGREATADTDVSFSMDEIMGLEFLYIPQYALFTEQNGVWKDGSKDPAVLRAAADGTEAVKIRIVGIIRPSENAMNNSSASRGGIGYLSSLTEYSVRASENSAPARAQAEHPDTDIFTGLPFDGGQAAAPLTIEQVMAMMPEEYLPMVQNMPEEQILKMAAGMMPAQKSESTYEDNMTRLGVTSLAAPTRVYIYPKSFENKDRIAEIIDRYNADAGEESAIRYTDYVGLIMSSVTTIIDAITYVLIAFVAISLVVSSIMIGIITYISVLERTKEIGILRAIGASKRDVSRVFNAETLIVGFTAGVLGILVTLLLVLLINAILYSLTDIANLAKLPTAGAIILICISMLLTFIAGLIPSRIAAKKDPVEALRTE